MAKGELKENSVSNYTEGFRPPEEHIRKADRANKIAARVIALGGYGIIFAILLILLFLVYQSIPLSFGASVKKLFSFSVNSLERRIYLVGTDEYMEVAYLIDEHGKVEFWQLSGQSGEKARLMRVDTLALAPGEKILSACKGDLGGKTFAVGTNRGRILNGEIRFQVKYKGDRRWVVPSFSPVATSQVEEDADGIPAHIEQLIFRQNEDEIKLWAWVNHRQQLMFRAEDEFGDELVRTVLHPGNPDDPFTRIAMNEYGDVLIAGTKKGMLYWFDLSDPEFAEQRDDWRAAPTAISALEFLIGNEALVVGDASGEVNVWFRVRTPDNLFKFEKIHRFEPHKAAVVQIYASPRNRNFLSVDANGESHLNYSTTSRTQLTFKASDLVIQAGAFAPKSNGIILVDSRNRLGVYALNNPHPEVTPRTLFGKVWYESYPKPEFVWQSTGGSDEFEPKLSLIPLIFGTFKGTFYAMIFSVPLAILAAIYVSQFAPRRMARIVKPTVEIMAALPSVVIGFLAGLYFSPLFEKHLMTIFLLFLFVPGFLALGVLVWRMVPEQRRLKVPVGWEMFYVLPLLLLGFWLAAYLAPHLELALFMGDVKQWMYVHLGINYDTRNSMVVGFALGFAVIPIIFTVAEDAMSNVPETLTSAALALGASRWQTVRKVILPAAAGGIFAGVMLGFGRAVGETMIVLMATGNTPILDFSPFNGFRAMSACIAVEIPEAPVGGTLYRVLFLTALLLFLFTFVLNTLSAVIGDRLRKKYARF